MKRKITINISEEVFQKIEERRGSTPHFRSGFINRILIEKLLPEKRRG